MKQIIAGLCAIAACAGVACSNVSPSRTGTVVRTVEISDVVNPTMLYAGIGDEVRWTNLRTNPVRIGFLSMRALEKLGCEQGVRDVFGQLMDFVTIPSGGSISLCFLGTGDLLYNVWFDAENPKGVISQTLKVRVEEG